MRSARIISSVPLLYDDGPDPVLDRPAHVRAGSGAAFVDVNGRSVLAVCQDDAAFLALVDVDASPQPRVGSLALPAGPGGVRQFEKARGNKMDKLDLESACVLPTPYGPRLFLFGSGSAAVREVVVEVDVASSSVLVRSAAALFAALRAQLPDAEINVEGACLVGEDLDLLQRGNGGGAVNAIARARWQDVYASLTAHAPVQLLVERIDLGTVGAVPLTFTDACAAPLAAQHGGSVFFLAAAEASPNAIDDGEVVGCALGVLDGARVVTHVPLLGMDGAPYRGKPEGLAVHADGRVFVVLDADDPLRPSELLRVALE